MVNIHVFCGFKLVPPLCDCCLFVVTALLYFTVAYEWMGCRANNAIIIPGCNSFFYWLGFLSDFTHEPIVFLQRDGVVSFVDSSKLLSDTYFHWRWVLVWFYWRREGESKLEGEHGCFHANTRDNTKRGTDVKWEPRHCSTNCESWFTPRRDWQNGLL